MDLIPTSLNMCAVLILCESLPYRMVVVSPSTLLVTIVGGIRGAGDASCTG